MFTVFKLLFLVLFARKWEVSADLIALGPGTLHLISSDEMPLTKQQMDSSRFSEHTYTFKQVQVWKNEGWFTDGGNSVHRLLKLRFFKVTLTFLWKNVAPLPSVGQRRHIMYHVRATVCRNAHVCLRLCLSFSVLLSPATYCEQLGPSAGAKAVRSTTFSAVVLEPFLSDHGLLECAWTPPTHLSTTPPTTVGSPFSWYHMHCTPSSPAGNASRWKMDFSQSASPWRCTANTPVLPF